MNMIATEPNGPPKVLQKDPWPDLRKELVLFAEGFCHFQIISFAAFRFSYILFW